MKLYNFEVYLKEPITSESGWEIAQVSVYAEDIKQAREILKEVPDFDVEILFNYSLDRNSWPERDVEEYANGGNYLFDAIGTISFI